MKEMYVVENNHIDENTWAIYQICYICGDGRTNVVQIKGTGVAICKRCLERAIEMLNSYQQNRFEKEFIEARHPAPFPIPTGLKGGPQ